MSTEGTYAKKDVTDMLGVGYHRAAYPATEEGGKRRVVASVESTIGRVSDLSEELSHMAYELEATIGAALTAGASWAHIGVALGMTRQGAQRKYADARRTYGFAGEEEKARLDKLAGVGVKRITFEVRGVDLEGGPITLSRHHSAEAARKAAAKLCDVAVWKVYPAGRAVPLR